MIVDAFKNKKFPMVPTSFSDDDKSSKRGDDRQSTMEQETGNNVT